jgi:superfamily II DNA/RNA helicase
VDGIDLVVHLDPPRDSKDYLHRAGRTARAGQTGVVASLILPKQRKQAQRLMDEAGVTAEELDAAPIGIGGKFAKAGTAMAELTGAREVPEPGDVPVFTVPMRPRDSRDGRGDRFGRDRYNRADRDFRGGSFERRPGGFDRRDRDGRGGERNGAERFGRDRFDRGERADSRGGFRGRDGERGGFERRDFRRDGEGRQDAAAGGFQGRRFDRADGERFGRGERRDDSFPRRDRGFGGSAPQGRGGERNDDQRSTQRDGERRGFEGRSYEGRSSAGRSFGERDGRDQQSKGRGFEGRGFEGRSFQGRSFEGRESGGFRDRSRDERDRFDRNRSADRFGRDDRPKFAGRPRQDRDRAARRPGN